MPTAACVPAARVLFQILDSLRGPLLGRADHGHRPHVRQQRVQRIEAVGQHAFDMIHGMKHAGVGFDQAAVQHPHRPGHAHPRLIVAVDVGAHGQFRLFLERIEQLLDVGRVAHSVAGAARGAGDRTTADAPAFGAHEHLRRGSNQLLVAKLEEEFVGTGAGLLDALEQLGEAAGIGRGEGLAQHHFVIVAAAHAFAHLLDIGHVLFRLVIAGDGSRRKGLDLGDARGGAFDALGGRRSASGGRSARKLVGITVDLLLLAIHEVNLVAQEQAQIVAALARELELDRIEAEQEVVAESAHQGEPVRQGMVELGNQGADDRKRGRLFAPLLLRKQRRQWFERAAQGSVFERAGFPVRMRRQRRRQQMVEDFSARIERGEDHLAVARGDLERRSQRCDVPTRIPSRKFITGRKVDAALRVELVQQRVQTLAKGDFGMRALDGNAAGRCIVFGTHKKPAEGDF